MPIQREFVLRYRSKGHIRFQVPERISSAPFIIDFTGQLEAIEGVVSVKLFSKQLKLSIRFNESVCSFNTLIKKMHALLEMLEQATPWHAKTTETKKPVLSWRNRFSNKMSSMKASSWLRGKYSDAKETVQAAKVLTKLGMKKPRAFLKNPEQTIIDFLNDILVLYLIKIHWGRITKEWIPNPFKYRYEWLAVWYLFFLLMRSKRTKV
jgi:hypothetical protein